MKNLFNISISEEITADMLVEATTEKQARKIALAHVDEYGLQAAKHLLPSNIKIVEINYRDVSILE